MHLGLKWFRLSLSDGQTSTFTLSSAPAFVGFTAGAAVASFTISTGGSVRRRRVLQRSGQANGPVVHRVPDKLLHPLGLGRCWGAVVIADHHAPHLRSANLTGQIDAHASLFESREVAALAGDFGGDALVDFRGKVRIHQNREFRLAQHIDEAGHGEPLRIDGAPGLRAVPSMMWPLRMTRSYG